MGFDVGPLEQHRGPAAPANFQIRDDAASFPAATYAERDTLEPDNQIAWRWRESLRVGQRSAPLRSAGPAFWVGLGGGDWQAFGMSMANELQKHYALLLGIGSPWEVKAVELKLAEKKVEIELGWQWGSAAQCPECGCECSIHDRAPERIWRHLDTMPFTTLIRARTPRAECPAHGVKTMTVPWAVADVARLLKRHLENLLTYLRHHITNAVTEGLNAKIQRIKSAACGFRNFQNYRIRILFFCGKLNLYPL